MSSESDAAGGRRRAPNDRLLRILSRLSASSGGTPAAGDGAARLCSVCAEVTEMSGAGIMVMVAGRPQGSVCTTDVVSAAIEELQYTLGEGPCVDAFRQGRPVVEPDLAAPAVARWGAFTQSAVDAGARAVFGFPMITAGVKMGALNLYRDRAGALSEDQFEDATVLATVAARAVVGMQAGAAPGALGVELEAGANFRFVVHQAAGMVAVQLGIPVDEALVRLRAHAFRHDRSVSDVANDVVERTLRIVDDAADDRDGP